jgi:hypothetical protein
MSTRHTPHSGAKSVPKKRPTDAGSIREVVQRIVELGPLPPGDAWDESVSDREEWLHSIVPPLTTDEAAALTRCFGPDDCGGLAWTLVHLIESAPRSPVTAEPGPSANPWLRRLWERAQRGRPPLRDQPRSLSEAVEQVIEIVGSLPCGDGRAGHWERMIETIAEQDSLPGDDYDLLASAVDEAFGAWSYATRRAIWLDTDSGMADDDDGDDDEMSINACGSALCAEVVQAVTQVAGEEAERLRAHRGEKRKSKR